MEQFNHYNVIKVSENMDSVNACIRVSDNIMDTLAKGQKFLIIDLKESRRISIGFNRFLKALKDKLYQEGGDLIIKKRTNGGTNGKSQKII
jgi:hypothetical protein